MEINSQLDFQLIIISFVYVYTCIGFGFDNEHISKTKNGTKLKGK